MKTEVGVQFLMFRPIEISNVDVLNDSFRIALDFVPRNFICFDCGTLNLIYLSFRGRHSALEIASSNSDSFSLCCYEYEVCISHL